MATLSERKRSTLQAILTIGVCDKNDKRVVPCWKTGDEKLTGKKKVLPFYVMCSYPWSCDMRKRGESEAEDQYSAQKRYLFR